MTVKPESKLAALPWRIRQVVERVRAAREQEARTLAELARSVGEK